MKGMTLLQELFDSICKINCLNEEIESLYHQASVKLGVSDSVSFVLYMTYINKGNAYYTTFTNHPESANRQLTQLFVNLRMRILFTLKNTMENLR